MASERGPFTIFTHDQGKSGQQSKSGNNKSGNDTRRSPAGDDDKQGGTHEQYLKAGQQGHKNDR
ncbi:hypothetical protein At12D13_48530 (plasmid) [Agrobacterium fabrum]|uniref:hypothetical protein n=1 Tax=Agrobacterium fabrum TaxID=1176649 RepID=UPI000EF56F0F|nr:hypothetical protein [Agrobacterium fabrum]AYM66005.1 hypothetical protein At12D13_48530 [Agrobacterium fabrum]